MASTLPPILIPLEIWDYSVNNFGFKVQVLHAHIQLLRLSAHNRVLATYTVQEALEKHMPLESCSSSPCGRYHSIVEGFHFAISLNEFDGGR